ncbi:MAG: alpha/beta fold hydrolase [Pseudomonadota bacterium]
MFKKLALIGGLIALLGLGALAFVTRDVAPRHPILREADLPSLVPARVFYADHRVKWDYVVSSDGQRVAYRKASLFGRQVEVKDLNSGAILGHLPAGIDFVRWHPTDARLRFIYEGQDWEVDPAKAERAAWRRISPVKLSGGWFKNEIAASAEQRILTWGKAHNRAPAHLWMVSQDGLQAEKRAEGTADTLYWVLDSELQPVLRLDSLDPATERLSRKTDEGWVPLTDISLDDTFQPLGTVGPDGHLLARSSRGRDQVVLVRFDARTGAEDVIFAPDAGDLGLSTGLGPSFTQDVIRKSPFDLERRALTPRGQVFLDVLAQFDQPVSLGSTTPSGGGRFVTQALQAGTQGFQHVLIYLDEGSHRILSQESLGQYPGGVVAPEMVRFAARDGLEIPAVLTRPAGIEGPIPFVVVVHGGPAAHRSLGYAHFDQFLANRGYGVLEVNFRGSTGFGKAFQAKGFRQFGRAMQEDLNDAARWLVAQGLADPDALAVMGMSYGGYAAALAMSAQPALFTVGISEFPMLDVAFQSRHHPGSWESAMYAWWRYFGKEEVPGDLAAMQTYSPLQRVDDLHGPLLVLAGERDEITPVQQVRDYQERVQAAEKDLRFVFFPNAGHGVSHWRDHLKRARRIENFLAEHLGGRSGGLDIAELAPDFID